VSRRSKAVKRPVPPDPRYDSQTVSKFVNNLMFEGKKSVAEGIFYSAMDLIEERTGQPGVAVFKQAVNNSKPTLEVKSRRVGGASLQVPVEVRPDRRTALAMRWLISFARARTEKTMSERLAAELILASKGEGNTIKKKEDTHRMANAVRRSGRTSTGTWSEAPPTRRLFTSSVGLELLTACLKTATPGCPVRSSIRSMAE
jgi:small subunit ribosomal protein S7